MQHRDFPQFLNIKEKNIRDFHYSNSINVSDKIITISILKPIKAGLPKEEFIKILENDIYVELDLLN